MEAEPSEIERALRAIIPTTSPTEIMDAVVEHTVAVSNSEPHRKRRRAVRRHGAYVRLRELEQSRQYNLRLDINDLKRQIAQLAQLRQMLGARTLNRSDAGDGSFVRMASVYYAVMERGYRDVVVLDGADRRIDTRAYLETAMSDDVIIGRFAGRQNFQPMMRRYTSYFSPSQLRLASVTVLSMDGQGQAVVRTTGEYSARMTRQSVEAIFPHVLDNERLVHTLLTKPLRGTSQFDFTFDRATHRIVRFDADMNFLPAFMALVPDPSQLAFLFSQAKISEEMFVGELDEFDSTRTPLSSPSVGNCDDDDDDDSDVRIVAPSPTASTPRSGHQQPEMSTPRGLKMADLLSPECDDNDSLHQPAVYTSAY